MDQTPMVDARETDRPDDDAATAIRAGLQRVLASDAFRGAPQLCAFLSFIVEGAVDGRGAKLKGYTIAVEALGRSADFDPQADPIVRVEAGRLRKALAQYYAGEGADDPVQIAMPVGGYAPVFAIRSAPPPAAAAGAAAAEGLEPACPPAAPGRALPHRRLRLAGVAALFGLSALGLWYQGYRTGLPAVAERPPPASTAEAEVEATASAAPIQLPVVAIAVGETPADPDIAAIAARFARLLVDAMARFDDLITVTTPPDARAAATGADYVFEINVTRTTGAVEGFGRLRSIADGRIVWTTSTSRTLAGGAADPDELIQMARRLAIRLAEPFGIIHADYRQASKSPAMRCMFGALEVRRTLKPEDHLAARGCIERLLERDRSFHPAWAQLALLILDEYASGLNPQPGPPLDRALGAALNAVRLAPSSARGQQVMMDVLFARGQIEEALNAGRQALANNPYDPEIMADLGARLVQLNRPAEGLPLLERAIGLSGGRPSWYDFYAFLGARLTGAHRLAESHAAVFATDDSQFGLLGRAMQCAAAGDHVGLTAALRGLVEATPLFGVDPRLYLGLKGFGVPVSDHIIATLGPALVDPQKPR